MTWKFRAKKAGNRYKLKLNELEKKPLEDLIKIHTKLWNDI